jgi:ribosomal protein L37AE/L43A
MENCPSFKHREVAMVYRVVWDCDDCGCAAQHGEARRGPKNALVQGSRRIYRVRNPPEDFGFGRRFCAR